MTRSTRASTVTSTRASRSAQNQRQPVTDAQKRSSAASTQSTSHGTARSALKTKSHSKEKQNGQTHDSDDNSDEEDGKGVTRETSNRKRPHSSDSLEPKKAKLAKGSRNGSRGNAENGVNESSDEDTPQRNQTKTLNGNTPEGYLSKNTKGNKRQDSKGQSTSTKNKSQKNTLPGKGPKRRAPESESSEPSESDDEVILTGVTRGSKQKALDSLNAVKTYEEFEEVLGDSEDEADPEDGVEEISSDSEQEDEEEEEEEEDDEEEDEGEEEEDEVLLIESDEEQPEASSGPKGKYNTTRDLSGNDMDQLLKKMKKEYADLVKQKDEEILRLRNEVKYKDQQLESMNDLVTKNMELEAKVSAILGSPDIYKAEISAIAERKVKPPAENKKEAPKKEEKDDLAAKSEDSDIEEIVEEKKSKAKRAPSVEVIPDEENAENSPASARKERRRSRRKKAQEEEEAEKIEALFVSDDEEEESKEDKKDKKTPKKKTKKEEKEEAEDKKNDAKKKETKKKDKDDNESGSEKDDDSPDKGRHNIRKLMADKKLKEETKAAAKEEKERLERVAKLKEKHRIVYHTDHKTRMRICTKLVLAFKKDEKTPLIEVNQKVLKKLKPHQVDAVKFMWDSVIETTERLKEGYPGSGCIIAHCMGLGKTLSVVTFVHTLLTHKVLKLKTCLVVCPLNTVLNWQHEWEKWLDKKDRLPTYEMATAKDNQARATILSKWHKEGGIMIMGYQLFRILATSTTKSKKKKKIFDDCLVSPGPDIVVCDEGHILKNDASAISKCMNQIRSKRRIILTGTPLQNNLIEYHCMVSFVKPSLLGTRKEFCNRFVNPITNGQHADSTPHDVKLMKRRAHVLHKMLSGCVQRRDYSALTYFLPPKHEYIISIRLSPLQIKLYEKYLDLHRNNPNAFFRGTSLFSDYQALMRIWTHPWVLKMDEIRQEKKMTYCEDDDDELGSFLASETSEEEEEMETSSKSSQDPVEEDSKVNDESEEETRPLRRTRRSTTAAKESEKKDSQKNGKTKTRSKENKVYDSDVEEIFPDEGTTRKAKLVAGEVIKHWQTNSRRKGEDEQNPDARRPEEQWWSEYVKEADHKQKLELSGKLVLLFDILRMAEGLCDKVLVFSQSILSLDLIEDFLAYKNEEAEKLREGKKGKSANNIPLWQKDEDYCRMDGSTSAQKRKTFTNNFNCAKNKRMRLFLISTKAGGLGINLDSANRVIIFDASWNPSHDVQSIFRAYRFGQEKDVYIYRFLAQGTMEEKIYERQVTKETLSQRVIDEHQLDRHFTASDLQELYMFQPDRLDDPDRIERPTPKVPKDIILAELLSERKEWVVGYHEHDSLLEKRPDEDLSEEERKAAWDEYEKEKQGFMAYQYRPPPVPVTTYNYQYRPPVFNPPPQVSQPAAPALPSAALTKLMGSGLLPLVAPPAGFTSEQAKLNFQLSQLPRVVQEILKYNPDITPAELQTRLRAFMGMHTKYSNVPGFAMTQNPSPGSSSPGLTGPSLSGQPLVGQPEVSLPGTSSMSSAAISDAASSAAAAAFSAAPLSSWSGPTGPSPAQLSQAISSTITAATTSAMPSRLPLPGRVPAFNR